MQFESLRIRMALQSVPVSVSIYYREAAFSANVLSTNARLMDESSDENWLFET